MIAHSIDAHEQQKSVGLRLDARSKIIIFFTLIFTGASTSVHSLHSFAAYYIFIFISILLFRAKFSLFLKRAAVAIPFVLMVSAFLPFFSHGPGDNIIPVFGGIINLSETGLWMLLNTSLKGMLGACSLIVLGITTPVPELLSGLYWFRVPKIFIELASFMIRYLQVIGEEVSRMSRARDSRGYRGKWLWDSKIIGQMIGTLFLRSYERSERIYSAMVSRGYRDSMRGALATRIGVIDIVVSIVSVSLIICARIFLV